MTRSQIAEAFENSFGEGSSQSLQVKCQEGLATELRFKIKRPNDNDKLANILVPTGGQSCDQVLVDSVGL